MLVDLEVLKKVYMDLKALALLLDPVLGNNRDHPPKKHFSHFHSQ
jgi:hypothetical protein